MNNIHKQIKSKKQNKLKNKQTIKKNSNKLIINNEQIKDNYENTDKNENNNNNYLKRILYSIKLNYKLWIIIFISLYLISFILNYSLSIVTINFIICFLFSYLIHYISHNEKLYIINAIHINHHKINNTIDGNIFEILYELLFSMSFIYIKVFIILFMGSGLLYDFVIKYINIPTNILLSLFYITVHNINYSYFHVNNIHELHHKDINTNLSFDICDIIFNYKNKDKFINRYKLTTNKINNDKLYEDIEDCDHYIPNIIILTIIIITITLLFRYYNINENILYNLFNVSFIIIFIMIILYTIYLHTINY